MTSPPDPLSSLTPEQRAAFELLLRRERAKEPPARETAAIPRRGDPSTHPLSFAQQRLWFLDQLAPGDPAYNIHAAVRLRGPLDAGALARALATIALRHEPLRARFPAAEGQPVQIIRPPEKVELIVHDLQAVDVSKQEQRVEEFVLELTRRPFDLTSDLFVRAALLQLAPQDFILVTPRHHIAHDAWSVGLFNREFAECYRAFLAGTPPQLPPCSEGLIANSGS